MPASSCPITFLAMVPQRLTWSIQAINFANKAARSHVLELIFISNTVTESGVRLLIAQKPIKRQGWWKGKFALFWTPATRGRADSCPKADSPHCQSGGKSFYRWLHAETAQSALTVILKLVISGLTSVILIVLSTINLQFRGRFVPISLRLILGIVAACVMATVCSSRS